MESYEIELDGKVYPIKSVRNLGGHSIEPYKNVKNKEWNLVGNAKVFYLESPSYNNICKIINTTSYDLIHLNSFFDSLCIKVLIGNKLRKIKRKPILLSPRGEFGWASFKVKLYKKLEQEIEFSSGF